MSSREALLAAFRRILSADDRVLVVHSSLIHFIPPDGFSKWDVLYVVETLAREGLTLAFPAFTFDFCRGTPFDPITSPSETGIIADWVRCLSSSLRTTHPIYSFSVVGPLKWDIANCLNSTTFGSDSTFAYFETVAAKIVMLGCGWDSCTQFHRYEEEAKVPYRHIKVFKGKIQHAGGQVDAEAKMLVRDLELDPQNDFSEAVERLRNKNQIMTVPLWSGQIESVRCQDFSAMCRSMLADNPWIFVPNAIAKKYQASRIEKRKSSPILRIALLGSSNLEFLRKALAEELSVFLDDRIVEIYTVPFGQLSTQVLDPASPFNAQKFDFIFAVDRLEDVAGAGILETVSIAVVEARFEQYIQIIERLRATQAARLIVNRFVCLSPSIYRAAAGIAADSADQLVDRVDRELISRVSQLSDASLFNLGAAATEYRGNDVVDNRLWLLGRFPFSEGFSSFLARKYTGMVLASQGRTARLIVLDLDNTLWGGILGEEGIKGVQLGGDFPGNSYLQFQQTLKALTRRGIALALCSKNDEQHALEALETLPFMVLRRDSFAALRINWHPKWQNMLEISAELSLSQENILFIDDNPVERANMKRLLPGVKVLDLPEDPCLYTKILLESPWLECLTLTREDKLRVESYATRQKLQVEKQSFNDLGAFYNSLELRLHVMPMDERNIVRTTQLINKTNQFNVTTRRYTVSQLEGILNEGHDIVVIGLEDRFSAFEIIGVLIIKYGISDTSWARIDSYLLSCRVLGRGVETGVLYWLMNRAGRPNVKGLIGEIIETERNTPSREVFANAGFIRGKQPGEWIFPFTEEQPSIPSWLTIIDTFPRNHS